MGIKVMEVETQDVVVAMEILAHMLADCKQNPRLLEMIPEDPAEIVFKILSMGMEHKKEVAKAGAEAKSIIEKVMKA